MKKNLSDRIRTSAGNPNSFLSYLLDHSDTLNCVRAIVVRNEENRKNGGRNRKMLIVFDTAPKPVLSNLDFCDIEDTFLG
jgi:hypothetical protein